MKMILKYERKIVFEIWGYDMKKRLLDWFLCFSIGVSIGLIIGIIEKLVK